jgi:hypothetical protein
MKVLYRVRSAEVSDFRHALLPFSDEVYELIQAH